jgi:hypothetical protein
MDTRAAAGRWADVWERSWPTQDVGSIEALYAEAAVFYSAPFRERQSPRAYVAWAFADEAGAECRFGEPIVDGDRAAVDWWAVMTLKDGSVESIAGTSLLRFDERGQVVEQRDAWATEGGRRELADWPAPRCSARRRSRS